MKKGLLFGIILSGFVFFCSPNVIHANATENPSITFHTVETEVFQGYTIGNYPIQDAMYHYYVVDVIIDGVSSTSGFGMFGLTVLFDSTEYQVVCLSPNDENPVCEFGTAVEDLSCYPSANNTLGRFGVAGFGGLSNTDGLMVSFLLRSSNELLPETGLDLDRIKDEYGVSIVETVVDENNHEVPVTYEHNYNIYYMLGDLDGNGLVEVEDVQILLGMLSKINQNLAHTYEEAALQMTDYDIDGFYGIDHTGAERFIMEVADANHDGVLDSDDAQEILDYYVYKLTHPNYVDTVNHIGTQQTYTYTYIDTNP